MRPAYEAFGVTSESEKTKEGTNPCCGRVILLVLWALGLVSSYTIGGYIHLLLVLAVVVLLVNIIQGRRTVV